MKIANWIILVVAAVFLLGTKATDKIDELETKVTQLQQNISLLNEQIGTEYGPSIEESAQIQHFIELKAKVEECCR